MLQTYSVLCRAGKMDNYSYILHDDKSGITAVIDPSEPAPIITKLSALSLKPQYILNTHHHFDHTDGNLELKNLYRAQVVANINDKNRIPEFDIGIEPQKTYTLSPSAGLVSGSLADSDFTFKVIDASAHTQGHVLYYFPLAKALFTGDTLFNLCIGGLFEGSPEQMFAALQKIRTLPDDTIFYPGHEYTAGGADAAWHYFGGNQDIRNYLEKAQKHLQQGLPAGPYTLAEEKKCNPYLAAPTPAEFISLLK